MLSVYTTFRTEIIIYLSSTTAFCVRRCNNHHIATNSEVSLDCEVCEVMVDANAKLASDKEYISCLRMPGNLVLFVTLLTLTTTARSTLISNLDLVFETFNPISMVRFFEFNDKGWNISTGCIQDMFLYLDGLHKDVFWALKRKPNHNKIIIQPL